MKNYKTTIGGALSALGTSIAALATVGAFTEPDYKKMALYFIICGALLSALGKFFGMLFAADKPEDSNSGNLQSGSKLPLILALFLPVLIFGSTGCKSLDPGARAIIVRSEQSIVIANATFDSAVHIDNANRPFFKKNSPAFHQFCDWLRTPVVMTPLTNSMPRGLAIVRSANAVKNSYKATNSTNDYAALISALAVVESATAEAQKFITTTKTTTQQ